MDRKEALRRIAYLAARLRDLYPSTAATLAEVTAELHALRRDEQTAYPPDPDYVAGVAERAHMLRTACEALSGEWCELADLIRDHAPAAMPVVSVMNAHCTVGFDWPKACDELNRTIRVAHEKLDAIAAASEAPAASEPVSEPVGAKHAMDFRSVSWFGTEYTFTSTQAACVKVLWEHWAQGTPAVGEITVLDAAGASGERLRDVFGKGKHPAWGTMIQRAGKGLYALAEPEKN